MKYPLLRNVKREIFKQSQAHIALVNIALQLSNTTIKNLTCALLHQAPLLLVQLIQLSNTAHPLSLTITQEVLYALHQTLTTLLRPMSMLVICTHIHTLSIVLPIVSSITTVSFTVIKETKAGQSAAVSVAQSLLS